MAKEAIFQGTRALFIVLLKVIASFRVYGRENLPAKGPFIIVSNHASYVDPGVIAIACDGYRISFMAKKELFKSRRWRWWFEATDCIPADRFARDSGPLKTAIKKLKSGKIVGIFPEGTRSPDGKMQKAEPGIGFLAEKTGAPIIPLYLSGTDSVLPRGGRWIRMHPVTARIGEAIKIDLSDAIRDKKKRYFSIGEKVMQAIKELQDEETG